MFNFDKEIDPGKNNDDLIPVDNDEERLMDKLIDNSGDWKDKPPDSPDLIIPRTTEIEQEAEQEDGRTLNLRNRSVRFTR